MGKPRRGDRFWGLSYLQSGIPLRSIPCLGSVVPSAFRGFVAREAGVLTPQGGFGGQSPETRYALHRLPGVSSPLRGFPCRWGNSLPFREGLGVGFLPSLQGRVGERLPPFPSGEGRGEAFGERLFSLDDVISGISAIIASRRANPAARLASSTSGSTHLLSSSSHPVRLSGLGGASHV